MSEVSSTTYPKRPPYFAHKFTRLLFRTCAAAEIGPDAALLLINIVHTEDARRYTGPVRFYAQDLADQCGFSVSSMERARAKAVAAGWLHYEPGAKRRMAAYWVVVPVEYEDVPDGPSDHADECFIRQADGATGEKRIPRQPDGGSDGATGEHPTDLLPFPSPLNTSPPPAAGDAPADEPTKPKKPAKEKKPRPPNPLFDAVAEVTGSTPARHGSAIGKVVSALRAETPPFAPDEVRAFGARFAELVPEAKTWTVPMARPSLGVLQKHIGRVRDAPPKPAGEKYVSVRDLD